ncbi:hypothetical protein AAU01_22920 [Paenarthrobacter aurescens]|uniref:Uncharacterized protein n=1 Tax=Paenarthrobacter aurescens TaxID=43663 RepID=A0A4Y3NED9_PAEAU|nr:hypothetical protein AAU01_22920 [Paenarthrobacter aurescens]
MREREESDFWKVCKKRSTAAVGRRASRATRRRAVRLGEGDPGSQLGLAKETLSMLMVFVFLKADGLNPFPARRPETMPGDAARLATYIREPHSKETSCSRGKTLTV